MRGGALLAETRRLDTIEISLLTSVYETLGEHFELIPFRADATCLVRRNAAVQGGLGDRFQQVCKLLDNLVHGGHDRRHFLTVVAAGIADKKPVLLRAEPLDDGRALGEAHEVGTAVQRIDTATALLILRLGPLVNH